MRRVLLGLLLIVAAAAAAVKGYIWYQVKHGADAVIAALAPVAHISYGGIKAGLGGDIGLRDIRIVPRGWNVPIRVRSVTLQESSLWSLVRAERDIVEGRAPRALSVSVRNVDVKLDTPAIRPLLDEIGARGLAACGVGQPIRAGGWTAMGYRHLDADLDASYAFNKTDTSLSVYLYARDRKFASVDLMVALPFSRYDLAPAYFGAVHPRLSEAKLRYLDRGFNGRVLRYCGKWLKITPEEAMQRRVEALKADTVRHGLSLSAPFYDAYKHYLRTPGEFVVRLDPAEPVRLDSLRFYDVQAALRLLGASFFIDGVKVKPFAVNGRGVPKTPVSPKTVDRVMAPKPATANRPPVKGASAAGNSGSSGTTANTPRFREVRVDELDTCVGDPVMITTLDGRRFDGILIGVRQESLVLRQDVAGGAASFTIRKSGVQSVRVYH